MGAAQPYENTTSPWNVDFGPNCDKASGECGIVGVDRPDIIPWHLFSRITNASRHEFAAFRPFLDEFHQHTSRNESGEFDIACRLANALQVAVHDNSRFIQWRH